MTAVILSPCKPNDVGLASPFVNNVGFVPAAKNLGGPLFSAAPAPRPTRMIEKIGYIGIAVRNLGDAGVILSDEHARTRNIVVSRKNLGRREVAQVARALKSRLVCNYGSPRR